MPRLTTRYRLPQAATPVTLPGFDRSNAVNARLAQFPLENEARQAQIDRANASEAKARYDLNKQIETDRQTSAFYNGLQELESSLNQRGYDIGSREHAEAFAAYAHEFPLARSASDVQQTLKIHSLIHDDQAALTNRMQQSIDAGKALGLQPQGASFVKGGNVDVRFTQPAAADNEGSDPEAELYKSRGLTKAQFLNPLNAKQGVVNDKGDFTTNFAPGQSANAIQFQAGSSKTDESKPVTHVMPLNEFNNYRQGLGQQPVPAFQYSGPSPTPTDQTVSPTPTVAPVQPSSTPDQTPIYTPSPSPESTQTPTTVRMVAPNGVARDVSPDMVDHYTKLGAAIATPTPDQEEQ